MARRRHPSTTAYGGGPPPHRKSMGRIGNRQLSTPDRIFERQIND